MSKEEIYNVLFKMSDFFASKTNRAALQHFSEKLDGKSPQVIKAAIEKHLESSKYFPTYSEIIELIKEVGSIEPQKKVDCARCKGSGSVVLFNKESFESSAFSCRCENGKRYEAQLYQHDIKIQSEQYAGDRWVTRDLFKDPRPLMTSEQRSERLNNYWDRIYKNAK